MTDRLWVTRPSAYFFVSNRFFDVSALVFSF